MRDAAVGLALAERPLPPPTDDYAELKQILERAGLFRRRPSFYIGQALFVLALFMAAGSLLFFVEPFWGKLPAAALLAFAYGQLGFIGHDAGHRQIFAEPAKNDHVMSFIALLVGMSPTWWFTSHNRHHRSPNVLGDDPHTIIPGLAFSEDDARSKSPAMRSFIRLQAFYFFPLLLLEGFGTRIASAQFMLARRARFSISEPIIMALHFPLYFGLLLVVMSPWQVIVFALVHQVLMGLYLGMTFAPNHKGMLILDADSDLEFLRKQVLTTRNIHGNWFNDMLYGGLNYQIEHHLFTLMPRHNLGKAQPIVERFCHERGIAYRQTAPWQSYSEVARYLYAVSH